MRENPLKFPHRMAKTKKQIKLTVRIPHIIIDGRNADPALLDELEAGLEELDARVRILGEGAKSIPHSFSSEEAMEEADMWVILSDELPSDFSMIVEHSIVPVMLAGTHKDAENYVPNNESGNSFLFQKLSPWQVYGSIVRAIENFGFVYDWNTLKSQCKELY